MTKRKPVGMNRKLVGQRLRHMRKALGYTSAYVSSEICVSPSTYSKYERGTVDITTRAAAEIARLYEVELNFVLLGDVNYLPVRVVRELKLNQID